MRAFSVAILSAGLLAASASTDWQTAGKRWWTHVQYLADDKLEGRNVGSEGYEKASRYVAAQFKAAGLQPAGTKGYFQNVEFTETSLDAKGAALSIVRGRRTSSVPIPAEAQLGYNPDSSRSIEAPVVFAGYGLVIPEAHHNDLEGLPVKGVIVAYLTGGPGSIAGNLRSHYSSLEERWKAFRAAGAIGMVAIANPKDLEIPWARQTPAWGRPHMGLAAAGLAATSGLRFSAGWNPEKADDLLANSGHTFSEILKAAAAGQPLPHFALQCFLKATVPVSNRKVVSENVAGLRPGANPKLRDQYVVVSAHLDHLGTGKPVNGDSIYNGAMDDASGVASLIEIARSLQASRTSAGRSILFLAVTGEEKGELGSLFFASHPSVKGRVVADLNMDMYLPLFPLKWLEVQGLNESTLGDDITKVAEDAGVKVQVDKEPDRNRFIRSDQYSFIKKGIPALAFKFGFIPGGPEEKMFKDWYTNRYHGVTDDVNQPVDLAAAAQFNAILQALTLRVANAAQPPAWSEKSFFRRFAMSANPG